MLGGSLVFGLAHRWQSADLLHPAEGIVFLPLLSDLSPDDEVDHHTAGFHLLARGGDSHQISPMDASETPTSHYLVALSYLVLNRPSAIGKRGKHLGQEFFISFAAEFPYCWCAAYK